MTSKDQLAYDPKASILTPEETSKAVPVLTHQFRKVTRNKVDPALARQNLLNISFMFLEKPHNGVYGFFKPRGAFNDIDEATKSAEDIIKNVDSCFVIHQAHMGHWNPITNNQEYSQDQLDVKTNEDEITLRDRAVKETARKNRQLQLELEEKKEEIKSRTIQEDDDEGTLDHYTKKRVAQHELTSYITQGLEKIKMLKKKLEEASEHIKKLDSAHPTFTNEWLENYNRARLKAGLVEITEEELSKAQVLGSIDE